MSFIIIYPVSKIIEQKGMSQWFASIKLPLVVIKLLYILKQCTPNTSLDKNCIFNMSIMVSIPLYKILNRVAYKCVNKEKF